MKRARKATRRALVWLLSAALIASYSSIAYAVGGGEEVQESITAQEAISSDAEEAVSGEEDLAVDEAEEATDTKAEDTSDAEETTIESTSEETSDAEAAKVVLNSDDGEIEGEQEGSEEDQSGNDDGSGGESGGAEGETPSSTTETEVSYIDASGNTTQTDAGISVTVVDENTTSWSDGWYLVNSDVEITSRIAVSGEVHLILADNAKLTASAGISVGENNSLTIYAQSTGDSMGELIATAVGNHAGIGGDYAGGSTHHTAGVITINGGTITATAGWGAAGIGGGRYGSNSAITINGGVITAQAGSGGAGIGSGRYENAYNITINGGTIIASGSRGAGIGAGRNADAYNIKITGGTITANGGYRAAGIGGGGEDDGDAYNITISGGTITANGGYAGTGIGAGRGGDASNITIEDGTVTATGSYGAAGIGVGRYGSADGITISGGTVTAYGGYDAAGIGSGYGDSTTYGSVTNITISGGIVTATGSMHAGGIGSGHYSTASNIKITGGIITAYGGTGQAIGTGYPFSRVSSTISYSTGGFYYRTSESGIFTYETNTDALTPTTTFLQIYPALSEPLSDTTSVYIEKEFDLASYFASKYPTYSIESYVAELTDGSDYAALSETTLTGVSEGVASVALCAISSEGVVVSNITLNVIKQNGSIAFVSGFSPTKTYDGTPIAEVTVDNVTTSHDAEVSFAYYVKDSDGEWQPLEAGELPTEIGTYKVIASLAANDVYTEATVELEFSISEVVDNTSSSTDALTQTTDASTSTGSTSSTSASADTLPQTGDTSLPYLLALLALIGGCLVSAAVALCKLRTLREC